MLIKYDDKPVSEESAVQKSFKPHGTYWSTEKATVKLPTPANVFLILLVLLLGVGGYCLAFVRGGDLKRRCTELDCYLSAIETAVQRQERDFDGSP